MPLPKLADFAESETDPYSEECMEVLDQLEAVEEDSNEVAISKPKLISVKLKPLELKEHVELPKTPQQKLTTPG